MTTIHKDHGTKKTSKEVNCEKCDLVFNSVLLMKNHMTTYHVNKPQIKCIVCDFKTEDKTLFIVHMESHSNEQRRPRPVNESICKWFAQGRCKFGEQCWNKHDQDRPQPPQCRFKSNCNMWPFCRFGHFEVCINYQDCRQQNCPLVHPQTPPFLANTGKNLPPDLNSQANFPHLQKMGKGRKPYRQ